MSAYKPSRWRTALIVFATAVVVLFVAGGVAATISVPYYAITPGTALNVTRLIHVPKDKAQSHKGSVLLTDVELVPLRALTYAYYKLFDKDADVEKNADVIGTGTPAQYNEAGVIDMDDARTAAISVALRTLRIANTTTASGIAVYATIPQSPAARTLPVGTVITAINQKTTLVASSLVTAVRKLTPGSAVTFTSHMIGKTKQKTTRLRLGAEYQKGTGSNAVYGCFAVGSHRTYHLVRQDGKEIGCLGVELQQQYTNSASPFPITIDSDDIIGPSAGLAFTLGLIETLDHGDLTAGQSIAATGTMSVDGSVGDVGGVAQKTVAVRNAGATVFFVPTTQDKKIADAYAGQHLRVVAVSNVTQAIATLRRLGGQISLSASRS